MADGHHFENSIISISEPQMTRFRSNLVGWCTFQFPCWNFTKKSKFCKFKMADGRHIENRFLAISRRHIDRLIRNLDLKYRITYKYRTHDHNCNVRKFKMEVGRHFENSLISISQPWIIRFQTNFVHRYKFSFQAWNLTKKIEIFQILDGGRMPYWISLLAISGRHTDHMSPYISRQLSDFDQIWYTGANFHSEHENLRKNRFYFKFKMADGRHIENRFLAISRQRIDRCIYRSRDQNGNFHKFKMADGRHIENSFIFVSQPQIIRFRSNLVGWCTFQFPWWNFNKKSKFCKLKMADGGRIKNRFLAISRRHIHRLIRNLDPKYRITYNTGYMTITAIFANSRWRTAAILKIALSPYLSRDISDFSQIWYTDTNFHSKYEIWQKKTKFFKFKMADGWHI